MRRRKFYYRRNLRTGRFSILTSGGKRLTTVREWRNIFDFLDGYTGTEGGYSVTPKS